MDARFIGFDLGIKDKRNNVLCVGDRVKEEYEEEINYGKIIYSTEKKAFGILWEKENYCELFADLDLAMINRFLERVDCENERRY